MEKILRFFAGHKLLINIIVIVVALSGIVSVFSLKQEFIPPRRHGPDGHYRRVSRRRPPRC